MEQEQCDSMYHAPVGLEYLPAIQVVHAVAPAEIMSGVARITYQLRTIQLHCCDCFFYTMLCLFWLPACFLC